MTQSNVLFMHYPPIGDRSSLVSVILIS